MPQKKPLVGTWILAFDLKPLKGVEDAHHGGLFLCLAVLGTDAVDILHPDKKESALCGRR